jgi:hypothetical protein
MFVLRLLVVLVSSGVFVVGIRTFECDNPTDEHLYNAIVTIKGNVQFINHPKLGKTPANGMYLLFQREDCKRCMVATNADINGDYKINIARGRYRIIVDNPSPPTYDLLAPDQARVVNATSAVEANQFDISLVVPGQK